MAGFLFEDLAVLPLLLRGAAATYYGHPCSREIAVLLDLRAATENPVFEADVCVIGAGIAGLTIARRFLNQDTRVVVLESGGLRYDEQAQEFNDGASAGMRYYDLRDRRPGPAAGQTPRAQTRAENW
ncbi:MAG TPA: FAD-dependent oxidoreductase, partial [Xanthomonadales bacterium]|nr:FAD-dependent oxidoreductase [Xanthomonadales bacterium]